MLKGQTSTAKDGKVLFGNSDGFESSILEEKLEDMYRTINLISSPLDLCEEEVDNKHYPFIMEPRGDSNLTLAKLNGGGYHSEPGAPRELSVKKCLRGKRMNGTLRKNSASLENAIRPVTADWNSWWKKEYFICLKNDDMTLNSGETHNKDDSSKEGCSYSLKKTPHCPSSRKKLPLFNTSSKPNPTSTQVKHLSRKCSTSETHYLQEEDGDKFVKKVNDSRRECEVNPLMGKSPQKNITDLREKLTRKKMASIYANFCLVISVPLRKLITDRQLKQSCKEEDASKGGKHRIFTGAISKKKI